MFEIKKGTTGLIKRHFVLFLNKTYIMTPHMVVSFLYFFHALKMIQSALDRKGDIRVNKETIFVLFLN